MQFLTPTTLTGHLVSLEPLDDVVGRSVRAVVMKRWRRRNPAAVARDRVYAEENRDRNKRRAVIYSHTQRDKINAAARAAAAADRVAATRSGTFTPEEDALVLRPDLTARQVAQLLGRTAASVARRRKRLRQCVSPLEWWGLGEGVS